WNTWAMRSPWCPDSQRPGSRRKSGRRTDPGSIFVAEDQRRAPEQKSILALRAVLIQTPRDAHKRLSAPWPSVALRLPSVLKFLLCSKHIRCPPDHLDSSTAHAQTVHDSAPICVKCTPPA